MKPNNQKEMKIKPMICKTKLWKLLIELSTPLPKLKVKPLNKNNKDDQKKAKMIEKLLKYQFENDINNFQTNYFLLQDKLAKMYVNEMIYGIKVRWDEIEKTIKILAGTDYDQF